MPRVTKQVAKAAATLSQGNGVSLGGVLSRIRPIGFDKDDGIKVLVYGQSGTGKTTLAGTFPRPTLWIVCSGSDKPGELRSIDTPDNRKSISQVVLERGEELRDLVEHLQANERQAEAGFATVVLDHVTGFQDLVLKDLLGLSEMPIAKTWGMATQQQYGQAVIQCKEMLRGLFSLRANVVVVAQERVFNSKEEAGSELITPTVGAGLMPSLAGWLNTAVEYIVQTFKRQRTETKIMTMGKGEAAVTKEVTQKVKGIDYCLRTGPDPVYVTKFRLPRGTPLPDYLVDADYDRVMTLVRGEAEVS